MPNENSNNSKKPSTRKKSAALNGAKKSAPSKQTAVKKPSADKNGTKKTAEKKLYYKSKKTGGGKGRSKSASPLRITPLGGLNEIGKNITLYEYGDDMFLVDCGMSFPDEDMPGIDLVIPDFSYVIKNADKIRGLVVTHGHEDHIGAIPYLLKQINIPIYGTALTLGLIEGKLEEHRLLSSAKLIKVSPGDTVKLGCFSVELIHVNHSIPDAVGLAIKTPAGTVIQTGDFKIDTTPIDGDVIDLARFAELGREGVLALLADSTNAERPGYTMSERIVGNSFSRLFANADGKRIIVATFSSNIHRVQQIISEAVKCKRRVAVSGRSMEKAVEVARKLGYMNVPDNVLISIDEINNYTPEQLVIVTTGSQGEPMSALHRMAFSDHRKVRITPNDMIIISATPIPGNEKTVSRVINELIKQGAEVVYERMYDVHVSGHACQEELKIMLSIVKPQFFIPVHGEQKHLTKHAGLAEQMGMSRKNILIADIGNIIELTDKSMKVVDTVQAGRVMVDGLGVGDVGSVVLRDRKHLAEDGIFVVVITMDKVSGEVISGPDVISRGFVYVRESEELISDARDIACDVLEQCFIDGVRDRNIIKGKVRDGISKFLYSKTKRSPMILPVIMEA